MPNWALDIFDENNIRSTRFTDFDTAIGSETYESNRYFLNYMMDAANGHRSCNTKYDGYSDFKPCNVCDFYIENLVSPDVKAMDDIRAYFEKFPRIDPRCNEYNGVEFEEKTYLIAVSGQGLDHMNRKIVHYNSTDEKEEYEFDMEKSKIFRVCCDVSTLSLLYSTEPNVILLDVRIRKNSQTHHFHTYLADTTEIYCFNPRFIIEDKNFSKNPLMWYIHRCVFPSLFTPSFSLTPEEKNAREFADIVYEYRFRTLKEISGYPLEFYWELCTIVPVLGFIKDELPDYFIDAVIKYYPRNFGSLLPEKQTLEHVLKYGDLIFNYIHNPTPEIVDAYIRNSRRPVGAFCDLPANLQTKELCEYVVKRSRNFFMSRKNIKITDTIFEDELKARDPIFAKIEKILTIFKNGLTTYMNEKINTDYFEIEGEFVRWLIEFVDENGRFPEEKWTGEIKYTLNGDCHVFYLDSMKIYKSGDEWFLNSESEATMYDIVDRKITYIPSSGYSTADLLLKLSSCIKKGYKISPDKFSNVKSAVISVRKYYRQDFDLNMVSTLLEYCGIDLQRDIENSEDVIKFEIKRKFDTLISNLRSISYRETNNLERLYNLLNNAIDTWERE